MFHRAGRLRPFEVASSIQRAARATPSSAIASADIVTSARAGRA
jgi:hypothetical protein